MFSLFLFCKELLLFERPSGGEEAVLVHVVLSASHWQSQEALEEFKQLALSAGAIPIEILMAPCRTPHAKYFLGTGKAQEIQEVIREKKAELVIFNCELSPAQERNLEILFQCRVVDRIGLILDIFAQRARTFEGQLQVELAQLQHASTRLVRGWTHLERQKGGIGLRGPGETQLESDRRIIATKIKQIKKRLEKVQSQRHQNRKSRERAKIPNISLVGYTNAGKSTLFNQLTQSHVYVADQLFATLDPTARRVNIQGLGSAVLTDTVGFIRHLPHELIDAFRATLEETAQADLLLHVVDAQDERRLQHIEQVTWVLSQIGADTIPQLLVYNKMDLTPGFYPHIERDDKQRIRRVCVSAKTGEGMEELHHAMAEILQGELHYQTLCLSSKDSKLRATLYELGAVISEEVDEEGQFFLTVCLPHHEYERLHLQGWLPDFLE